MITYLTKLIENSPMKLISYADYMNTVLYHPEKGYYMKDKQKIGRQGDFITSSNVDDIVGETFAKWFAYVCENCQLAPIFCEVGAGTGRFARAFLKKWQESIKKPLKYIIVESSPYHRRIQNELLMEDFSFEQASSLDELESFEGMIYTNELFDALPVHVIEKQKGQLFEIMVGIQNEHLFEKKIPLSNRKILLFLQETGIELHENQRIEIPLLMENILLKMSRVLSKGFLTTVDYGYTNKEWMQPSRRKGSLRGYYHHQLVEDVLQHPGEMDVTSHVHFDWLIKRGRQLQFNLLIKLRQDEFLLKNNILQDLGNHNDANPFSYNSKRNRAIRSLIMSSGISSYFHVLIQQKGIHIDKESIFID